jgi:hypothetical protein
MSIPASRFDKLDRVTNVPVSNFTKASSNDVLNADFSNKQDKIDKDDSSSVVNKAKESATKVLDAIGGGKAEVDKTVREVKGATAKVKDITNMPAKELDSVINKTLKGNPSLASVLKSGVNKNCTSGIAGFNGLGKPYDFNSDCGNGKRKSTSRCNNGEYANVINKFTNGAYQGTMEDLNSSLQSLYSLAAYGYDLDMCKVFDALSSLVNDRGVKNRAAAGLFTMLANKGNTNGFIDLAVATAGLEPKLENPSIVSKAIASARVPGNVPDRELVGYSGRVNGASELVDTNYAISKQDGIISTAEGKYGISGDYKRMKRAESITRPNPTDLSYVPSSTSLFTSAAFAMA